MIIFSNKISLYCDAIDEYKDNFYHEYKYNLPVTTINPNCIKYKNHIYPINFSENWFHAVERAVADGWIIDEDNEEYYCNLKCKNYKDSSNEQ